MDTSSSVVRCYCIRPTHRPQIGRPANSDLVRPISYSRVGLHSAPRVTTASPCAHVMRRPSPGGRAGPIHTELIESPPTASHHAKVWGRLRSVRFGPYLEDRRHSVADLISDIRSRTTKRQEQSLAAKPRHASGALGRLYPILQLSLRLSAHCAETQA